MPRRRAGWMRYTFRIPRTAVTRLMTRSNVNFCPPFSWFPAYCLCLVRWCLHFVGPHPASMEGNSPAVGPSSRLRPRSTTQTDGGRSRGRLGVGRLPALRLSGENRKVRCSPV